MKPGHLSDRFILEEEPHTDNFSESESEIFESDFEDDWEACMSSVEEDECFYDVVSLENSKDAFYYSFPTSSLGSNFEANLSGLAMDCEQPSKSDQVPDLNENAYLTQKSQVLELYETHLVEGRRQVNNNDNLLRMLPNIMEKETHVDSEQTDIG